MEITGGEGRNRTEETLPFRAWHALFQGLTQPYFPRIQAVFSTPRSPLANASLLPFQFSFGEASGEELGETFSIILCDLEQSCSVAAGGRRATSWPLRPERTAMPLVFFSMGDPNGSLARPAEYQIRLLVEPASSICSTRDPNEAA